MARARGAVTAMMAENDHDGFRRPTHRIPSVRDSITREIHQVMTNDKKSALFEEQRVKQAGIWNDIACFYAAKTGFLRLLKRYEQEDLAGMTLDERANHFRTLRDNVGATVLHIAILCESDAVVEYLVTTYQGKLVKEGYATKHHDSPYEGETALHLAVVKGRFDIVKLLIQYGAEPNAQATGNFFDMEEEVDKGSYLGSTALHFAVATNQREIADYLLNHGADPTIQDKYGHNALHLAVYYSNMVIYDLIVERDQTHNGELQNTPSKAGLTPLKLAVARADKEMLHFVLEKDRVLNWAFGHVEEYLYPLTQLDTWSSQSVLDIIADKGTLKHAKLISVPPIRELLQEKWRRFGRTAFFFWLLQHVIVIVCLTTALLLTRDPNDYSGVTNSARLVLELIGLGVVVIDTIIFEVPELINVMLHLARYRHFESGTVVFFLVGWLFRAALLVATLLRIFQQDVSIQRVFMSFTGVLAWLYLLNFGRGVTSIGRFILLTERMTFEMRNWIYVFLVELLGFSLGYEILFYWQDRPSYSELDRMQRAIFSLFKWVMGEFDFDVEDAAMSHSPAAAYVLFAVFTIMATIILFNILIALMTNIFVRFEEQADVLSELQWAKALLQSEKRGKFFGLGRRWRSGVPGNRVGMDPDVWYKAVLVRNATDGVKATSGESTSTPGYTSSRAERSLKDWEKVMSSIKQKNAEAYIKDWAELAGVLHVYEAFERQSVSRETLAYILFDLVFNNALDKTKEKPREIVRTAARRIAAQLDPDNDDDVPLEAVCTFCRLSRMSLLNMRHKYSALVIVDMQNDYLEGTIPMKSYAVKRLLGVIQKLRTTLPWKLVVFTQDWHPENHCSFLQPEGQQDSADDASSGAKKRSKSLKNDKGEYVRVAPDGEAEAVVDAVGEDEATPVIRASKKEAINRKASVTSSIARQNAHGINVLFTDDVDDMKWPPHCIQDTDGADLHMAFELGEDELLVRKGTDPDTDAYSAVWDNKHVQLSELYGKLFDAGVETVYVCGVGFDCQAGRTARDLAAFGFDTRIVRDASTVFDDRWEREMLLELKTFGVKVTDSHTVSHSRVEEHHPEAADSSMSDIAKTVQFSKFASFHRRARERMHQQLLQSPDATSKRAGGVGTAGSANDDDPTAPRQPPPFRRRLTTGLAERWADEPSSRRESFTLGARSAPVTRQPTVQHASAESSSAAPSSHGSSIKLETSSYPPAGEGDTEESKL